MEDHKNIDVSKDYYFEAGKMVMTKRYHLKRGYCCGNKCRHCPFDHENVSKKIKTKEI